MAIKRRSNFKLLAAPVKSLDDVIPEPGAIFTHNGILYYCDKWGFHPMVPGAQSQDFCALELQGDAIEGSSTPVLSLFIYWDTEFFVTATAFTPNVGNQTVVCLKDMSLHITMAITMEMNKKQDVAIQLLKDGVMVQEITGRPSEINKPKQFFFDFFESYLNLEVISFGIVTSGDVDYKVWSCSNGIKNLDI